MDSPTQTNITTLFEDDGILAVMKPAGLKVHGDNSEPTLETLVAKVQGRKLVLLHRLDRDTSGIVLLAKRKDVAGELSRAFEQKKIRKTYWAVVEGLWSKRVNKIASYLERDPQDSRKQRSLAVESPDARRALSTFRVLATHPEKTWLEVIPKTGRTHQIRVHCAGEGHPILGDKLYGHSHGRDGLALHAYRLMFRHPLTGAEMNLLADPPETWQRLWLQGFKG